jgi:hypothetical protein
LFIRLTTNQQENGWEYPRWITAGVELEYARWPAPEREQAIVKEQQLPN